MAKQYITPAQYKMQIRMFSPAKYDWYIAKLAHRHLQGLWWKYYSVAAKKKKTCKSCYHDSIFHINLKYHFIYSAYITAIYIIWVKLPVTVSIYNWLFFTGKHITLNYIAIIFCWWKLFPVAKRKLPIPYVMMTPEIIHKWILNCQMHFLTV